MALSFDLSGKVFVVTGATGALAGAVARHLASAGAKVAFLSRSVSADGLPDGASAHPCDVLDKGALEKAREDILKRHGRIDGLINGAGGNQPGAVVPPEQELSSLSLEDFDRVIDLNLKGTLLPSLVFAEAMLSEGGSIVNFSSMAAQSALTRVAGYSAAKSAVENLTRWMAVEWGKRHGGKIRVNAVAPGFFIGKQNKSLLLQEDGSPTERGAAVLAKTPFGRFGEADEISGAVHYLLSDASRFVTGTVLAVDGGFSAYSGV